MDVKSLSRTGRGRSHAADLHSVLRMSSMQSMSFAGSFTQQDILIRVNGAFIAMSIKSSLLVTEVMSLKIRPLQVPTKMKVDGYVTIDFSFENQERLGDQIDILS